MDYKETIKERIKILPEQLRVFVLDESWRRDAEKIGKKFNFNEEKYASFENEVFLVLLCFEPKNDFMENIKKELEIDGNVAGWVAEDAEKNIFSKVVDEVNSMWQVTDTVSAEGPEQSKGAEAIENVAGTGRVESIVNEKDNSNTDQSFQSPEQSKNNNVGQSFEQIILNQAKAMQPARPATPEDLPTEQDKPRKIHNYVPGSDPYREPLE